MHNYDNVKPIESKRNRHGFKGVKRNQDCKQQFIAVRGNKMIGRFSTAYEAGQAYAWESYLRDTTTQQEFDFNKVVGTDPTEIVKEKFLTLLKNNPDINFSTREVIDEVFDLRPSQRRQMLKEKNRISFNGKEYSYGMIDTLFKRWASQKSGVHMNKKVGMNYYFWHETNEDRPLILRNHKTV